MISVTVAINGRTILHQFAVNITHPFKPLGVHTYRLADGRTLTHLRQKGAKKLVIKMLKMTAEPA